VIKKRFPTMDHLVDAGIMTEAERIELDQTDTPHGNWSVYKMLILLRTQRFAFFTYVIADIMLYPKKSRE
jgi:hypothetical protein